MYLPLAGGPSEKQPQPPQRCRLRRIAACAALCAFLALCLLLSADQRQETSSAAPSLLRLRGPSSLISMAAQSASVAAGRSWSGGLIALVGVAALVATAYVAGTYIISTSLKAFAEYFDHEVLGIEVTMDAVDMQVTKGRCEISNLQFCNPDGFNQEKVMMTAEKCMLDIEVWPYVKSRGCFLEVGHLELKNVMVYVEKNSNGINVQAVLDNLKTSSDEFRKRLGMSPKSPKTKKRDSNSKLILHKIDFHGIKMQLTTELLGKKVTAPVMPLKDIHFDDFGKDILASDFGAQLFASLASSCLTSTKNFMEQSKNIADSAVNKAKEKADHAVNTAKSAAGSAAKKVTDVRSGALDMAGQTRDHVKDVAGGAHGKVVNLAEDTAKRARDKAINVAEETKGKMQDARSKVGGAASDVGKRIDKVTAKMEGAASDVGKKIDKVTGKVDAVVGGFKGRMNKLAKDIDMSSPQ